jgi:predicted dinucleotide-binding enzyme
MATLGLIGSGNIGSTVARLAAAAGWSVVLSNSRSPSTLDDLVSEIGPLARAATPAEAAAAGDLVLVSIPVRAIPAVPAAPLAGKVVMDTDNYYPQRDGQIPELDDDSHTVNELLADHLGTAHVVKVFNNIHFRHLAALARPAGAADRSALAVAGDDAQAKAAVMAFVEQIGYDAVDAGPLAEGGRRFQTGSRGYGGLYGPLTDPHGMPTSVEAVRAKLGL